VGRLKTLARGVHSDIAEAGTRVIRDERTYAELWGRLRDAPERPRVDFEHETVVAAFTGRKPSGGYTIEIVSTDPLTTVEREPDGFAFQALTSPYHVVRAPSR
jgi:PrcB C-terminal